jgi:hypothetical protein
VQRAQKIPLRYRPTFDCRVSGEQYMLNMTRKCIILNWGSQNRRNGEIGAKLNEPAWKRLRHVCWGMAAPVLSDAPWLSILWFFQSMKSR